MRSVRTSSTRFIAILLITLFPLMALAAEKKEPVGRASGGPGGITWTPEADHEQIRLTIVGPDGTAYQRDFNAGQNPFVRPSDLGKKLEDGEYTYQMLVVPRISQGVKKALADARAKNDDETINKILRENNLTHALVQSGGLRVVNGQFVSPEGSEPTARDGQAAMGVSSDAAGSTSGGRLPGRVSSDANVIADDLIVQGSECVGIDCSATESFGFDTVRLKENNLRINFDDTSSAAGYPSNDWRLIANDSASGGANKFVIEDSTAARNPVTVEAGAPANTLYVDSTGRIGIQQATPLLDLHITTGNTPAVRLEQTNTGGFTAQTWDIGGNEANFFIRDLTGGSRLPFRLRPGAPTSSIDVAASGNVGIGTASPSADLHVYTDATSDANITIGEALSTGAAFNIAYNGAAYGRGSASFNIRDTTGTAADPNPSLRFFTADLQRMILDSQGYIGIGSTANPDSPIHYTNGTSQARLTVAGVWQDASSRKAKENITELATEEAMQALHDLKPVKYNYKAAPEDAKVGFIAEDVPELVAVPTRDGLSALDIVGVLTKVVQEQQKTIDELKARLDNVEKGSN